MGGCGVHADRPHRMGGLLLLPSRHEEHDLRRSGIVDLMLLLL